MYRALLPITLAVLAAGCGGPSYKLAAVSGKVTMDGKPGASLSVMFSPVDVMDGPPSVGTTDAEGRYTLMVQDANKRSGAVVGKHKVFITVDSSHDTKPTYHVQVPEWYNRKTILTFDVPAGGKDDADFNLSSKKPG